MSSGTPLNPSPEGLLEELDWVRRLARRLVDADAAEDVAQETMLAALSARDTGGKAGQGPGHRRAWLSRVARNIALNWRRSSQRRTARESAAARPELSATSDELLARTEMHQELVRAVQELPEPYRATILLRYLEGRSPQEIGRHMGVPASTVRSRLARGVELLRERLDGRHGRVAWMGALAVPLTLLAPAGLPVLGTVMKSKTAVATALIVASGLALYASYQGLLAPSSTTTTAVMPEDELSLLDAQSASGEPTGAADDQRQLVAGETDPAPTSSLAVPSPIHGAFRLLDEDGREEVGLDGEADFLVWKGDSARTESHGVRDGRFAFALQEDESVEVVGLVLGGAPALPLAQGRRFRAQESPLVIDARWTDALVLVVLDKAAGTHVNDVEVIAEPAQFIAFAAAAYPGARGAGKTLVQGQRSPVWLAPTGHLASSKEATLHVRAPGYAWSSVVVDFTTGGERRVELDPGAGADVFLDGAQSPRSGKLILRMGTGEGRPDWVSAPGEKRRFELDGLHPGEHTVSFELGDWWDGPKVLGATTFVASTKERAQVVLTLEPVAPVGHAPLAGVLVLPSYWRERNDALHLREVGSGPFVPRRDLPIDGMERVPGQVDTYRWDAGEVKTGRWELSLPEPFVPIVVDVGPAGVTDARLEVGAPGRLSVEVVDDHTGQRVDGAMLSWITIWPKGGGGGGREMTEVDPQSGRYEILAPQGEIDLLVVGRYSSEKTVVAVGERARDYTMRVRRNYRLSVVLMDGDTRVPLPALTALELEHLDGDGKRVSFGMDDGQSFVDVDQPGRYRFVLPPLAGYLPPEPQVVELVRPERYVHVVTLTKE